MEKNLPNFVEKLASIKRPTNKNFIGLLKIACLIFVFNTSVMAQCLTGTQTGTINPMITWQTQSIAANVPNYYSFNAQAGVSYTFTYCDGGGSTTGDSYLTISDNSPVAQASNDDYCGLSSNIFWTCNTTGVFRVYVSGCCPCSNTPAGTLAYRATQNNVPCAGQPGANSVPSPNYSVCPGASVQLGLANSYTVNGITYQWQSSTVSGLGPWTSISGATLTTYTSTPINSTTYFSAIVTCVNGSSSIVAATATVLVAGTSQSVVPYNEDFETVGASNLLPNCSWSASGLGGTCQTFTAATTGNRSARSGSKFADFNLGSGVFYTNGIQLNAGVTYSTSVWYKTEAVSGFINWADMSILVGTSQTTVGATTVASTNGPAVSPGFKALTNTFTVPNSGLYYVAVKATYSGSGAPYLVWDDLQIIAPCSLNSPSITVSANSSTICAGQSVVISASGGASYTWNNGSTGSAITVSPNQSTTYVVTGISGASGCPGTVSKQIIVNPVPSVVVLTSSTTICEGSSVNLLGSGANTYVWDNGATTNGISVSPLVSTTYSVYGTNQYGCSGQGVQLITVNPKPTVSYSGAAIMCKGDNVTLTGSGATSYSWSSSSSFLQGSPVSVSPNASTVYTLTGATNGCSNTVLISLEVSNCVGINNLTANANAVKVYPNPTNGEFTVEVNNISVKTVEVVDLTGRVVVSKNTTEGKINININNLSNGVYYVKLKSSDAVEVVKILKQ